MPQLTRILKNTIRAIVGRRPTYRDVQYKYEATHTVIDDFAEFSGISVKEIERLINDHRALCASEWAGLQSSDFDGRSSEFYGRSEYYIFDLLSANHSKEAVIDKCNAFDPGILDSIREHSGRRFLEFGGGTGIFCEIVADLGKEVTYLDIPGRPLEFSTWRFEKYELPIRIICASPDLIELRGTYDLVYTDAVIEHLPPRRQEEAVRSLCRLLSPGGLVIMLVDIRGTSSVLPMHTNVDIQGLHEILNAEQFVNVSGTGTCCSIWRKAD